MNQEKIRALIVGPAFPLRGGIANFNEALCRAMNSNGYDAEIVSFSLQYPSFLFPGKTQFDNGAGPSDLKIHTLINSVNPLNWIGVARFIREKDPEILIVRYWLPFMGPALGTIIRRAKKNSKMKVIAITDNVIPHESRPGDSIFTKYFVKSCDGFIAMSDSVLKDLSNFTNTEKKVFLPHPIYDIFGNAVAREEALKAIGLPEGRYILFFGFIRKYKGLDLLLDAMKDERIKKLGISLIVAGEYYEDEAPYLAQIDANGIREQVVLRTSYIPSADVRNYFCAADLVAQPYRSATQSGVTQIAYHFDKPMLVTDVGGLPEIVPNNKAGYVTEVDPRSIADALADFYENKREPVFKAFVKEEKKRFSWAAFVQGLTELSRRIN
jgi:glycosyltransferase involved in cell wall biosynthesis